MEKTPCRPSRAKSTSKPPRVGAERLETEGEGSHRASPGGRRPGRRARVARSDADRGAVPDLLQELQDDVLLGPLLDGRAVGPEVGRGPGARVVVPDADGVGEARPQAFHRLGLDRVVGQAGRHPVVGPPPVGRVGHQLLERTGEGGDGAPDGDGNGGNVGEVAAVDLEQADRLRVVLAEGVGEGRPRVGHRVRPADALRAMQVAERDIGRSRPTRRDRPGRIRRWPASARSRTVPLPTRRRGRRRSTGTSPSPARPDRPASRASASTCSWVAGRGVPSAAGARGRGHVGVEEGHGDHGDPFVAGGQDPGHRRGAGRRRRRARRRGPAGRRRTRAGGRCRGCPGSGPPRRRRPTGRPTRRRAGATASSAGSDRS